MAPTRRCAPPAPRPDRITPEHVRATHAALLDPTRHRGQARPIDDLLCFYQFDRWTVRGFAERQEPRDELSMREWRSAEALARRRLQRLQRLGLLNCLAGRSLTAQRADLLGRPGDLFSLSALGARVLTRHLKLGANALKAPDLALDRGRRAPGGLVKQHRARKGAWDPHLFACQRLAVRHEWVDDPAWRFMRQLPYALPLGEREVALIPDAWMWGGDRLFAVELEGTEQRDHIREKHAKYAALAGLLDRQGRALQLTIVFASAAFRRRVLHYHETTYARRAGGYAFAWLDYETALAAPPGELWGARQFVDRQEVRERQRDYHEREADAFRGW